MRLTLISTAFALAALSPVAQATLGQPAASVAIDARALRATSFVAKAPGSANFARHQISLADGGMATEFVDPATGAVFAVSWSSAALPDLSALLGAYFPSLKRAQEATRAPGAMRSPGSVSAVDGDVAIVSTGHMRSFRGQAYLASQLPAGFDIKELSQ